MQIFLFSDETFCIKSQIMVEKFPNFRQDLSAFVRGWQLYSGHWCHMTLLHGSCDTSWRMTAGMSRPVFLFGLSLPWWILVASLVLLLDTWSSLSNSLASFRLHLYVCMYIYSGPSTYKKSLHFHHYNSIIHDFNIGTRSSTVNL